MWGILRIHHLKFVSRRITPTYVGNTRVQGSRVPREQDHPPYACGEYWEFRQKSGHREGSPLRMWGILAVWVNVIATVRITPTYVGNTNRIWIRWLDYQDHPYVRGEY